MGGVIVFKMSPSAGHEARGTAEVELTLNPDTSVFPPLPGQSQLWD